MPVNQHRVEIKLHRAILHALRSVRLREKEILHNIPYIVGPPGGGTTTRPPPPPVPQALPAGVEFSMPAAVAPQGEAVAATEAGVDDLMAQLAALNK